MKKITLLLCLLLIPFHAMTEPLTITKTVAITTGGMNAIIAMAEYATDSNIGVAFSCTEGNPKIVLQFGGFPGAHHPIHLYVEHENKITFFSGTVRGSPQAGFHSPIITQPEKDTAISYHWLSNQTLSSRTITADSTWYSKTAASLQQP